jgi:hypothetical protein
LVPSVPPLSPDPGTGLKLKETKSCGGAVIITGFSRSEAGEPFQAERTVRPLPPLSWSPPLPPSLSPLSQGLLSSGMVMLAVNGKMVFGRPFDDVRPATPLSACPSPHRPPPLSAQVMEVIKVAARPMKMVFVPSPDKQLTFEAPPTDLVLGRIEVPPSPLPSP